jgi:hypothetical protein
LRRDAIENRRINSIPVEEPAERLRAVHPEMPELRPTYRDEIGCHLYHPESDITLYPVHVHDDPDASDHDGHFQLVLGVEAEMDVPFVVFSAEEYRLPDDVVLFNRYEGRLLATPWGEALVVPCDLAHEDQVDSAYADSTIPVPEELVGSPVPTRRLEGGEMESYYNLAMAGVVQE